MAPIALDGNRKDRLSSRALTAFRPFVNEPHEGVFHPSAPFSPASSLVFEMFGLP